MVGSKDATIADVARVAGVSRASVSKVIRDAYGVSGEMKAKVHEAIDALGYRPRLAARSLRGRSFTIGVALAPNANFFLTSVTEGLMETLLPTPYQVILAPWVPGSGAGHQTLLSLMDRQVDGVLVIAPAIEQEWIESLGARLPLVMLGRHDMPQNFDAIASDDALGSRLVVDHLVELGHRTIWHMTSDPAMASNIPTAPHAVREAGYRKAMAAHGLEESAKVLYVHPTERATYEAVCQLLDGPELPTALYVGHDELALGALRALAERGMTTREMSVVGYDDADPSGHPLIALTTVNQGAHAVGHLAADLLVSRIEGRTTPHRELLTPRLIVRGTSHPPRST